MNEQELEKRLKTLEQEVTRLNALVDRIYGYTHLGIRKPSLDNDDVLTGTDPLTTDIQLQQLIQNGDIIATAKRYVALTGVGLLEAKTVVQKMMR
jgi:ribosomal protein L7/L12